MIRGRGKNWSNDKFGPMDRVYREKKEGEPQRLKWVVAVRILLHPYYFNPLKYKNRKGTFCRLCLL